MFQPRTLDVESRLSSIVGHLRAIETELGKMGRGAGRQASAGAAAATATGNQIAETIAPILSDIVDRFRRGQRTAIDEASNYSDQAISAGTRIGSDALAQFTRQARDYPLLTVGVALGIGLLIGFASRRN
jgi:ElaB/YqjD/DUF883 family membrane-anchored ribosome-binding protein